MEMLLQQVVGS
jgi:hypothetical protein